MKNGFYFRGTKIEVLMRKSEICKADTTRLPYHLKNSIFASSKTPCFSTQLTSLR